MLTVKGALELNPNNVPVQFGSVGNLKVGSLGEALGIFHRAIELNLSDSAARMAGIAHVKTSQRRLRGSAGLGARALARNPSFAGYIGR
jgi:hypothetical protein